MTTEAMAAAIGVLIAIATVALSITTASAEDGATPPLGFVNFCTRHAEDCRPAPVAPPVVLTDARRWEMQVVNTFFNNTIRPLPDADNSGRAEWWTYADSGSGDCEEYALEKRRALLALGWPSSALLLTTGFSEGGEGHAVLTVVTDRGDLVLDNLTPEIVPASETPHRLTIRQSRGHPLRWVKLGGGARS
jgi:predicted transglutaminase-like cysteine proteinase